MPAVLQVPVSNRLHQHTGAAHASRESQKLEHSGSELTKYLVPLFSPIQNQYRKLSIRIETTQSEFASSVLKPIYMNCRIGKTGTKKKGGNNVEQLGITANPICLRNTAVSHTLVPGLPARMHELHLGC